MQALGVAEVVPPATLHRNNGTARVQHRDAWRSLRYVADDGDRLSAREAERLSLEVTGPFGAVLAGEGDDNLVLRAARAVADAFAPRRSAALSLGTGPARSRIFSEVASGTFSTPVARGSTNNSIQSLRITSSLWGPGTAWRYGESRCG